jgi:glutamate synthase domain-containing protein 3
VRERRYNTDSVTCEPIGAGDEPIVRELLAAHVNATRSPRSLRLLNEWDATSASVLVVKPN